MLKFAYEILETELLSSLPPFLLNLLSCLLEFSEKRFCHLQLVLVFHIELAAKSHLICFNICHATIELNLEAFLW